MSEILDSHLAGSPAHKYEFYRDFMNMAHAEEFAKLLHEHDIPFKLERSQTLIDSAIVGHGFLPTAIIKVPPQFFIKIREIIEKSIASSPEYIDTHYLQEMSDMELIDIIKKPDEWTVEDAIVAQMILERRGIPISKEHTSELKAQRREELQEGKKGNIKWIIAYLLFVLVGGILFTPLLLMAGIGMGWFYWQDKSLDADGHKFYTYEEQTRLWGQIIFYVGWASLAIGLFMGFYGGLLMEGERF